MASPVKIERLEQARVVKFKAQALVAAPGAVPGAVETTVTLPDGMTAKLDATILCGFIGTTPAARSANYLLSAVIKHDDNTKLIFKWTQLTGAATAVPAGDYRFAILE